jgi:hypothetical protein
MFFLDNMFFNTIKIIFISLLLIALIHYLYDFFKNTLTVPKVKDLVNKPAKRYDEMFDIIRNNNAQPTSMQPTSMQPTSMQPTSMQPTSMQPTSMQPTSMQPTSMQPTSMQDELKNFLNDLKKPTNNNNNTFQSANEMFSGSYTSFSNI